MLDIFIYYKLNLIINLIDRNNEAQILEIITNGVKPYPTKLQQFVPLEAEAKVQIIAIKENEADPQPLTTTLPRPSSQIHIAILTSFPHKHNLINAMLNTSENKCIVNNKKW
jgi:hypothetical protein